MLSELADHGIVTEVTGRGSWKAYAVTDHGTLDVGLRRRSSGAAPPAEPAKPLHPLLAETDTAIAKAHEAIERATRRRLADYPAVGADVEDDAPSTRPPRSA